MLKKVLFCTLFSLIFCCLSAQDTLTLASGDVLYVYIQEIGKAEVSYVKSPGDEMSFRLPIHRVASVRFQEKSERRPDFFNDRVETGLPPVTDTGISSEALADTSRIWRIETTDGNEYFGTILEQNRTEIKLRTSTLGVINIPRRNIRSLKEIEPKLIQGEELWLENPQATRYFFGPNGYGLKKGEGYYQNLWIFFNQVSVGITDNASIGLGVVPLFLFGGTPSPVWITPKFSIPVVEDQLNLGGGAFIGTVLGDEGSGFFGVAYGMTTFGNRDRNLNIGLGYGFADGEWSNSPTVSISGMLRTGKKGYLLTENYLIGLGGTTAGLISIGGRTVWGQVALDYGGFIPVGDVGTLVIIPWLGVTVAFGR